MNRHALDVLQFPEALAVVAGQASSALGAQAVRALEPYDSVALALDELRRVDQMSAFLFRAQDWHMPPLPDVRSALQRLAMEGSVLDAVELRDIAVLLRGSAATRRTILQHESDYPLLAQVAERLVKIEDAERRIRDAVDDGGEVRDNASSDLARLRRDIRAARGRIVERLEGYIATLPSRFQVHDASVSLRDGRYVIPIRREGRGEVGGLVHDESATGATLFVEPPIAIELMNRLRELEIAEAREVLRILRELTESLRPAQEAIAASLDALIAIDSLYARARYALHVQGHRPEISDARAMTLVHVRHPLLLATTSGVVPFDLTMEPDERTLLVSGPNTGGKTVLLKAIGLVAALAQAGVIPPVGPGTKLPLFRDIYADIGDEQSIEASLSTFSAHVKNLREIVEHADRDSLALIDEMGSGTDPAEGGALADAILRTLTRRGALTIATTHLGQLKQIAAEEGGVVNASLQFDAVELRPTYRLLKGVPGRSYGLAIARRLGLPADVLDAAESAMPETEREASQLLAELEAKDRALSDALADAARQARAAAALREQVEERESALKRREREAERRARQQARDILLNAREEVEAAIRELREAAAEGGEAAVQEAARAARARVEQRVRREAERTPAERADDPAADDVGEGSHVRITASGLQGVVVELRDERAIVEVGGLRVQVPVAGLTATAAPQPVKQRQQARGGWNAPDIEASSEVDLRGLRAEEVAGRLNPALDAAVQAALPSLRVIHGKGTGALREVVTGIMNADHRVKSFRPGGLGEGGTGVTVAELK